MQPREREADPTRHAREYHIPRPVLKPQQRAQRQSDGDRTHTQQQPDGLRRVVGVGVNSGDDDETNGVVRDGEEEQEVDRGMTEWEDLRAR